MKIVQELTKKHLRDIIDASLEEEFISKEEAQRLLEGNATIDIIARASLSMAFDYSTLSTIYAQRVNEEEISQAYYTSLLHEPEVFFNQFKEKGKGASCLTGSYILKALCNLSGIEAEVIGVKDKTHFATLANNKWYLDSSLNLMQALSTEEHENPIFDISLKGNKVVMNGKSGEKMLWEIQRDVKGRFEEHAYEMSVEMNPLKAEDKRHYISIGKIVHPRRIKKIFGESNNKFSRVRVKFDEDHYSISAKNKDMTINKDYKVSYDKYNQIIGESDKLFQDIALLTGIQLNNEYKDSINQLHKKLLEQER